MSYTEQDVERVARALYETSPYVVLKGMRRATWDEYREYIASDQVSIVTAFDQARAALEAIEREPLEDVIHDLHPGTKICHVWPLREGGYEAEIGVPVRQDRDGWWDHERSRGEGATIDEAIRAAVIAAKGDE